MSTQDKIGCFFAGFLVAMGFDVMLDVAAGVLSPVWVLALPLYGLAAWLNWRLVK